MTTTIDTTVDRNGNVQITVCDGGRRMRAFFESIEDAKRFHHMLGFQIRRAERANAMRVRKNEVGGTMIVEGREIDHETVEWFTAYILGQQEPFRAHEMVTKAVREDVARGVADRFIDRLLQKLRKAGKIRFAGGYWSVVSA